MAQHDFAIAGGAGVGGAAVRTDIQDGLQALATNNSGNTPPATLYANQRWTDLNTPSSAVWTDFVYDGATHIPRGCVDTTDDVFLVHGAGVPIVPGGRCSLTSGLDVTVADVTAATAIYYALSAHDFVPLWDGTRWDNYRFTQLTLALNSNSGHTGYHQSGKNFDLFVHNDAGTLRLSSGPAWTNDTTRADALARKNGRWVNNASILLRFGTASGNTVTAAANTALYVGTFRATADGQTEDSAAKRLVWNTYNRRPRGMKRVDTTNTWNYSTATYQQANASAANQLAFVRGLNEDAVWAAVVAAATTSGVTRRVATGIGLDSSTVNSAINQAADLNNGGVVTMAAHYSDFPGLGYHDLRWLEIGAGVDTQTWVGDNGTTYWQSGMTGGVMA